PTVNIINSNVEINEALISNTATAEDEHDVIAGYHALEFMLWGQDLNEDGSADTLNARDSSGGQRPLTDFTTDQYADRRILYLQVVAAKLVADLQGVRDGWVEGASYRTAFTTVADEDEAKQKLTEILTGMGTLSEGELAGERMQISFSSNSQEDEHSCFSDNTHRDIWLNAEGIANSFYGVYNGFDTNNDALDDNTTRQVDGYGLDDYLTDAGLTDLRDRMTAALTSTETAYTEIDTSARNGQPVDTLIQDNVRTADNPMYKTIIALNAQSAIIAEGATTLGIDDTVVDDDASECDTTAPDQECGG
ncbi:MAG: imelysin family protein, partial [Pseudomonadota bacterium]